MYEIILGADNSEARARAAAKAVVDMPVDTADVHVTILHDFTENPEGASVTDVAAVRRAREVLEDAGFEVTLEESSGDPAEELVDLADDQDANMIVVGGRKRTPTGKVLFGSVTQGVILSTERPVLVVSAEK
jgi:nucleotide-binding universal stress UspA family protein